MTIVSDYVLQIAYAFFSLLQELGFHFFLGILACAAIMAVKRKPFGRIAAIVCVVLFPAILRAVIMHTRPMFCARPILHATGPRALMR